MKKAWYSSKTVIGVLIAALGALSETWSGSTQITATVITAGLAYAGYGIRDALTD